MVKLKRSKFNGLINKGRNLITKDRKNSLNLQELQILTIFGYFWQIFSKVQFYIRFNFKHRSISGELKYIQPCYQWFFLKNRPISSIKFTKCQRTRTNTAIKIHKSSPNIFLHSKSFISVAAVFFWSLLPLLIKQQKGLLSILKKKYREIICILWNEKKKTNYKASRLVY